MNTSCLMVWNLKCNSLLQAQLQISSVPFTRRTQLWTWKFGCQCLITIPGLTSKYLCAACTTSVIKGMLIHLHCSVVWVFFFSAVGSISSDQWIISFIFTVNRSLILYIQRAINACSHSLPIKYKKITILLLTTF